MGSVRRTLTVAGIALAVFGLIAVCSRIRDWRTGKNSAAQQAVDDQRPVVKANTDTTKAKEKTLTQAVTHAKTILNTPRPSRPAPVDTTVSRDSLKKLLVSRDAKIDTLINQTDSLRTVVAELNTASEDYLASVHRTLAAHEELEKRLQKVIDSPKPRRWWGLGANMGPGLYLDEQNQVKFSKGLINVGFTVSF